MRIECLVNRWACNEGFWDENLYEPDESRAAEEVYLKGIRKGLEIALAVAKSKRIALEVREEYGERRLRTTSGYFIAHDFFAEIENILDGKAEIPTELSNNIPEEVSDESI